MMGGMGQMVSHTTTALPMAGGVGDQPAALLDAFALLEHWTKD